MIFPHFFQKIDRRKIQAYDFVLIVEKPENSFFGQLFLERLFQNTVFWLKKTFFKDAQVVVV